MLKEFGQEHMITYWQNSLKTFQEKSEFLGDLGRCDFELVSNLKKNFLDAKAVGQAPLEQKKFEPVTQNIFKITGKTPDGDQASYDHGLEMISQGKVSVC
jgi:hypothetical protein